MMCSFMAFSSRSTCAFLVGITMLATMDAFSIERKRQPPTPSVHRWSFAESPDNNHMSRRHWVTLVGTGVVGSSALLCPSLASADVTNKVASSTALRNVKRAAKQLATAELYAANDNYEEMRAEIRVTPLAEIRKNCFVLVRGAEDGPKAQELASSYQAFIQRMETMDNMAGVALRGRKVPEGQLYENYKTTVAALGEFVRLAEESAEIPVQYENESS